MSLDDMLTYAEFHIGDGTAGNGQRVLSHETLEQMRVPRVPKHGTDDEMGIGWHLRNIDGVMTATGGGTSGGNCLLIELVAEQTVPYSDRSPCQADTLRLRPSRSVPSAQSFPI